MKRVLAISVLVFFPAILSAQTAEVTTQTDTFSLQDYPDANTNTRMTFGFEQAGASSANTKTSFLADFMITGPLVSDRDAEGQPRRDVGPRVGLFGNFRFSSVPEQVKSSVKDFSSSFVSTGLTDRKVNDIVQGFSTLVGAEVRLGFSKPFDSSATDPTEGRLSISAVGAVGITTPVSPRQSVEVFEISDEARVRVPELSNVPEKQYVAFVSPERSRFFREWYAGVRLRTYVTCTKAGQTLRKCREGQAMHFPNIIDLMFGQNEQVTGGTLRSLVGRMDAFYSLPNLPVYLFGTIMLHFDGATETSPLLLKNPSDVVPIPGPTVVVLPLKTQDRDYWKIGLAMNLENAIRKFSK